MIGQTSTAKENFDSQQWNLLQKMKDWGQNFATIPDQADAIASNMFPNSARDASMQNAFRHSLGTGMMAQALGGGAIGATLAKMAGWGWEGIGAAEKLYSSGQIPAAYAQDTMHDLNANNIGASIAARTQSQAELVNALAQMARASQVEAPPGMFSPGVPRLTRSVK